MGHTARPRSSPRLAHVALRHAGGPHSTSGRPPAPNACTRPQKPQHGGRASVGGVRVRSRTHRAAAALRARSAHVPPPQQREGIGPTPTHRRNHTPTRPQHVHTGRREGREATGGYAHRCEVVAPLALASGPARTCRARRERKAAAAAPRGRAVPIHLTGPTQLGSAHGRSAGTGWAGESPCGWRRTAGSPPWAHDVGACLQPRTARV